MFYIIACMDSQGGIGKDNGIPWHLKADLKRFRELTGEGSILVMGRKTWDSLKNKPLQYRTNVVITRDLDLSKGEFCAMEGDGCIKFPSVDQAILYKQGGEPFWVIGGGEIFKQTIGHDYCRKLYITRIHKNYGCDVFFPKILPKRWRLLKESDTMEENGVQFHFEEWGRKAYKYS